MGDKNSGERREGEREVETVGKKRGREEITEENVQIAYINVNRSTVTIQTVLETRRYHIVIAAELWIYKRKNIPPATVSHPKYMIINHIHHNTYLVCYARKDINVTAKVNHYIAQISIRTEEDPLRITAIYLPPDMEIRTYIENVRTIFKTHSPIIVGDFNAHNEAWSLMGQKNNTKGNTLNDILEEEAYDCKNPKTITRQ